MKTLSELNEELYEKVGRLHTYEGFLSEAQAKQVAENIFKEYSDSVEEYFEETKLRREKRLFELEEINRILTPKKRFFGLFANKSAREAEKQIKPIAEAYRAAYALDDVLFDALRSEAEDPEEDPDESEDDAGAPEEEAAGDDIPEKEGEPAGEEEEDEPDEPIEDDEEIIEDDEPEEEPEEIEDAADVADPPEQMEMDL